MRTLNEIVPALGVRALTPLYDFAVRYTVRGGLRHGAGEVHVVTAKP